MKNRNGPIVLVSFFVTFFLVFSPSLSFAEQTIMPSQGDTNEESPPLPSFMKGKNYKGNSPRSPSEEGKLTNQTIVNTPVVNLRKGPSTDSPRVGVAYQGQTLKTYGREGNWLKVKLPNDIEGWLWAELVQESERQLKKKVASATDKGPMEEQEHEEKEKAAAEGEENESKGVGFGLRVVKPRVNIRNGPGASYQWIGSAKKNDLLIGLTKEDEWYRCRMPDGREGWVIDWACKLIPVHSEAAQSEQRRVITDSDGAPVRAGPAEAYPVLGVLSMGTQMGVYLEEAGWLYIKRANSEIEGWVTGDSVYNPKKRIDPEAWKDEILNISQKLCNYYDQKKKGVAAYRDAGWHPSFMILQREKDIRIEPLSDGWRLNLTFSLRNISMETLFPLSMETAGFSLSTSDRLFFMVMIQTFMENEACEEIEILFKGLKKSKGTPSLKWVTTGGFIVNRSDLLGINLDKIDTDDFWALLTHK